MIACFWTHNVPLLFESMADIVVTVNALQHFSARFFRQHLVNYRTMTIHAGVLGDTAVPWLDLNRFVKILQREGERMKESIVCFRNPLHDRMMWEMAIVAHRNVAMA
jgi:hypothetical protein